MKYLKDTEFRKLYPFRSHTMDIHGFRYHYLDEGAGDPVIMVHGNPTWSFYYRHLVKGLSHAYRTIVPDHIGCGLSDKPGMQLYDYRLRSRVDDFQAFIQGLHLQRPITLIVHDWGGMIGMAYARRHPERIGRLIILNTAAFPPPHGKRLPVRLRLIRNVPMIGVPAVLGLNLFVEGALIMAPRRRLSVPVRKGLRAPYDTPRHRLATLKFVQDIPLTGQDPGFDIVKDVGDHLHALRHIPMLICWGAHDFVFDRDYYDEWRRRFPDAEAHYFKEAGHYILEDIPETVLKHITSFLKRHPL
ncbi:Haloalkane dehalogenase-like protein [Olavius algarvensis associated proteobacterium Delta 3]|nr:Haloalkane dehalogenase-like protein [Olavius algarvensis associated proteobacterium Delta 3]CAB5156314.1 Haloalkane dehalogenase-like protein [Olavius algarvensis associated proteobacterium Delta 3]